MAVRLSSPLQIKLNFSPPFSAMTTIPTITRYQHLVRHNTMYMLIIHDRGTQMYFTDSAQPNFVQIRTAAARISTVAREPWGNDATIVQLPAVWPSLGKIDRPNYGVKMGFRKVVRSSRVCFAATLQLSGGLWNRTNFAEKSVHLEKMVCGDTAAVRFHNFLRQPYETERF